MQNFPKIIGVLNITPDSFSDGGDYLNAETALKRAMVMIEHGVDIIDIGGESTRPGAEELDDEEELRRVMPVIEAIRHYSADIDISIDTTKYKVAEEAIQSGANIINDISGLQFDTRLARLAAENDLPIILMHMKGKPRTMQMNPIYSNLIEEIYEFLKTQINLAKSIGAMNVWADVGIGFGKTFEHNIEILRNISRFKSLEVPLVLGISRKSFIGKALNIDNPKERDIATLIIHSLLLENGVDYIRIHNTNYFMQLKKLFFLLK